MGDPMTGSPILLGISTGQVTTPPTRAEIRAHIALVLAEAKAKAAAGGNPTHVLLDHGDKADRFVALLPEASRPEFVRVYTEEMEAALAGVKVEVARKENTEIAQASSNHAIVPTIALVVVVVFVSMLLRALN